MPNWVDYFFVLPTPVSAPFIGTGIIPSVETSDSVLNFGTVIKGKTSIRSFTVTAQNLASDLTLSLPWASNYRVTPDIITPDEAANGATVTVTYVPTAVGNHNEKLYIGGGGSQNVPPIDLKGTCVADKSITATPSTWDFETVNKGDEVSKDFLIKGTNLDDEIIVVSQWEEGFSVSQDPLPATGGTVRVTFKPSSSGDYNYTFYLSSDNISIPITVTGTCVVPPKINTDKATLDFGTIYKNEIDSTKFTVTGVNLTGNLTLSVNKPWFTVSPATITAADAADGKEVTVIYNPTAGGNHIATLTISSVGAESKLVSLTGKCAAIEITPSSHDFGTVKEGSNPTATFTVKGINLSERISIASALVEGFTISPSDDLPLTGGIVTVTFSPTSGGDYSQVFTLSCGNTYSRITVKGKCAAITTNKSALYFNTVRKGETKTKNFTVTGFNLTHDLTLTPSNKSLFEVIPEKITAAEAIAGVEVTVTYKPNVYKDHSGTITISGQDIKSETVRLSGKCADITVSPASYNFGTCTKNKPYTYSFKVTGSNIGEQISVVDLYDEEFTVSQEPLPANGGYVTVTFTPKNVGRSSSHTFYVTGGGITTPVSVTGKCGTPDVTVSDASLIFTPASHSKSIIVTGHYLTGNLTISCSNAPFAVTTKTITPSQAATGATVTVECNPSLAQSYYYGTITISGGGAQTKTVTLSYNPSGSEPAQISLVEPENEPGDVIYGGEIEAAKETWGNSITAVDELTANVNIFAEGQEIIIDTPVEQNATISDLAGRARNVKLQAGRNVIPVNDSGIYIVRIREKTAKMMLR